MTRLAFISDLHLEFREKGIGGIPAGHVHVYGSVSFPTTLAADALILAGDIHPYKHVRDAVKKTLEDHYGFPVFIVRGNHDHWGSDWAGPYETDYAVVNNTSIAMATLWTRVPLADAMLTLNFSDFKQIRNLTLDKWNDAHQTHLEFLRKANADVVVTHHGPTHRSIHPRFHGDSYNVFFSSNLDMALFPNTKLWIHGHTHDEFDYVEEGVRVMCNPLGYPFERKVNVGIKIIDV